MNHDPRWTRYRVDEDLEPPRTDATLAWVVWLAVVVLAITLAAGDWWMPAFLEWLGR